LILQQIVYTIHFFIPDTTKFPISDYIASIPEYQRNRLHLIDLKSNNVLEQFLKIISPYDKCEIFNKGVGISSSNILEDIEFFFPRLERIILFETQLLPKNDIENILTKNKDLNIVLIGRKNQI
jgi:hypothetical protein